MTPLTSARVGRNIACVFASCQSPKCRRNHSLSLAQANTPHLSRPLLSASCRHCSLGPCSQNKASRLVASRSNSSAALLWPCRNSVASSRRFAFAVLGAPPPAWQVSCSRLRGLPRHAASVSKQQSMPFTVAQLQRNPPQTRRGPHLWRHHERKSGRRRNLSRPRRLLVPVRAGLDMQASRHGQVLV